MTVLIGLRHGQSEYSLLGLCSDDPARKADLTPVGRQQAVQRLSDVAGREFANCTPYVLDFASGN